MAMMDIPGKWIDDTDYGREFNGRPRNLHEYIVLWLGIDVEGEKYERQILSDIERKTKITDAYTCGDFVLFFTSGFDEIVDIIPNDYKVRGFNLTYGRNKKSRRKKE